MVSHGFGFRARKYLTLGTCVRDVGQGFGGFLPFGDPHTKYQNIFVGYILGSPMFGPLPLNQLMVWRERGVASMLGT